jgi:putative spermidine/putrescine transport system substrate-binding protein
LKGGISIRKEKKKVLTCINWYKFLPTILIKENMMKKQTTKASIFYLFLAIVLLVGMVGCAQQATPEEPVAPVEEPAAPVEEPAAPVEEPVAPTDVPAPTEIPPKIGEGRTLVVGIWGAEQEQIVREFLIPEFTEITGADVELVLGGSSDRYARIYAEVDAPTMDVVYLSISQTQQASKDAVILPPNPAGVPEFNNLYPQAQEYGGYGVSFMSIGLMVNTEYVTEMPTSWLDLWKPEYKGKVAPFVFPGTQGTAFLVMAARVHGGGETNIDPGFEALKELKPFPMILSGIDETNLAFEQGDVWFAPQIRGYVESYKSQGGKVEFVTPEEGTPLAMNAASIPINSKNVDLAEVWINLHLSQAVQEAYAKVLFYAPTNKTVVLDADLAAIMPYGEDQVAKLLMLDNLTISTNQSEWVDRWNREILD